MEVYVSFYASRHDGRYFESVREILPERWMETKRMVRDRRASAAFGLVMLLLPFLYVN